ncbi:MAG: diacylglycerol kinase family protein [bacterium]
MEERRLWRKRDTFSDACRHAWRGVVLGWQAERNTKAQFGVALTAVLAAVLLGLPASQVAVVILVSAVVIISEFFNTAIEELSDVVSPEYDEAVGEVKDIAAGAVLLVSLAAIIVGFLLLGPPMVALVVS